jgi:hypothetical protein
LQHDFDPLCGQKSAFTATALDLPYRRLMRDVVLCASELRSDCPAGFSTNDGIRADQPPA